jgi:hypothetical protein
MISYRHNTLPIRAICRVHTPWLLEFHRCAPPLAIDPAELIVRAGQETLCLEFEVGLEIMCVVAHGARVSKFEVSIFPKRTPVHVRHCYVYSTKDQQAIAGQRQAKQSM